MSDASAALGYFDNYTKRRSFIPQWIWWPARVLVLAATFGLAVLLFDMPETGLRLFWGLAVPILPILLVFLPGLWRQVCPMALLNQLPRVFRFGQQKTLPEPLRNAAFAIALASFVAFVALRQPVLNHSAFLVGAGVLLALILAFAGGLVFKGRSGWCGTFCALGPIQRVYGQAPVVVVRNGYCETCVGCQKSCYDFNPRAAVYADVYDDDPRYAGQRRLFMGFLPGFIIGYFVQGAVPEIGGAMQAAVPFVMGLITIGLYGLAIAFLPTKPYRVAAVFSAAALAAFYWWSGPVVVDTLAWIAGTHAPDWLTAGVHFLGVAGGLALLAGGLRGERRYEAGKVAQAPARMVQPAALAARSAAKGREVTDRSSGVAFEVSGDQTLLDAIQSAGLKINYGCRAGICGADAVAICEGMDNIAPAGEDETSTLRRLGLEGQARLACMCKVSGPIVIDRDPQTAGAVAPQPVKIPAVDKARQAGIERIVIVGNGVAGMGVAEALRRESLSVAITLVTDEPSHFYNRMAIGRLIYDASGTDGLQLVPDNWFTANNVTVMRNTVALAIDRPAKRLLLATGEALPYDRLVLATGARASTPTPDFLRYSNAFVLRSADDARALRSHVQMTGARRAVVIGGGVLGVEAADALRHLGLHVAILQRGDRLMNAQLDETGARTLASYLDGIGVQSVCNVTIAGFEGAETIVAVRLAHGPRVRADLFVACLGVAGNTFLAEQAGLTVGRGVRVDASMQTDDPDIFAVGDVAEQAGSPSGLWPIASAQAAAAVKAMFGEPAAATRPNLVLRLKCDGIDVYSLGNLQSRAGDEEFTAPENGAIWWRIVVREERVAGAVWAGPPGSGRSVINALQSPDGAAGIITRLRAGEAELMVA